MLKTMLTIAALMLAQVVQLSAAHAGGGYPGRNNDGQTPKHPIAGDTGLPAHHGEPDLKPPRPTPQVTWGRIPPKIHGPYPGPMPGVAGRQ